jgi:hypothetical protein
VAGAVREALRPAGGDHSPGRFRGGRCGNTFMLAMADATAAELMPGLVEIIEQDAPGVSHAGACR